MESVPFAYMCLCGYGFVIFCSLSFELLHPHGSGKKLLSKSRSGYCHWQMLHIPYDSYSTWTLHNTCFGFKKTCSVHMYYIHTHCDESIFNTDMWLSQKHCFIGRRCYTVPCKSHRGHTFHFYLYRVSKLNTHKYLRSLRSRKYLYL